MNNTKHNTKREAAEAVKTVRGFVGQAQLAAIAEGCYGEERQWFIDRLVALAGEIEAMPQTYQTDGQGDEAVAHLHYFSAGADWYITERDIEAEQLQAFGLADFGHGPELGYICITELIRCGVELDLHWTPRQLSEIKAALEAA